MKIFLQRVRQAGASNSRAALFVIFATIFVLGAALPSATSKSSKKNIQSAQNFFKGTGAIAPKYSASPDYVVTTSTGASIVPGTDDTGVHNDDGSTSIALPFPVQFYDETFATVGVASNGYLFFTNSNSCCGFCVPNVSYEDVIAPGATDLYTADAGAGQGIFTSTSGVAPNRIFNIEWRTQHCCTGGPPVVNFEARLYEGQKRIDFIYGSISGFVNGIGVQRDTGSKFTVVSCGNTPASGTQYTFTISPQAPVFTSDDHANFPVGFADTFLVTTTGNSTPSLTTTGLPAWVTATDNGDGSMTLSATPDDSNV